jgi:hypothetical protein
MVYRIAGGIALALLGISMLGIAGIPPAIIGIALLVAGIALLAGF